MSEPVFREVAGILPEMAVEALERGNKIQAIKIVALQKKIGLKQAKEEVETYLALHPRLAAKLQREAVTVRPAQMFRLILFVILAGLIYLWLTGG